MLGYEFPDLESGVDANWVNGDLELRVSSFGARQSIALRTDELDQSFVREALAEFDALVKAFPVRGHPFG